MGAGVSSNRTFLEFANMTRYQIKVTAHDDDDYDWDPNTMPAREYNGVLVESLAKSRRQLNCAKRAGSCNVHVWLEYTSGPHIGARNNPIFDQSMALGLQDNSPKEFEMTKVPPMEGNPDFRAYAIVFDGTVRFAILPNGSGGGDLANWMTELDDSRNLFDLFVPGTHNSVARGYSGGGISEQCQSSHNSRIPEQLDQGIRAFDFRFEHRSGDRVVSIHMFNQYYDAWNIIRELGEWISAHPKEIIFAKIRASQDCAPKLIEAMTGLNEPDYTDLFWREDHWPETLGEARGKVICITKIYDLHVGFGGIPTGHYPDNPRSEQLHVGGKTINVQDFYIGPSMSEKIDSIKNMLVKSQDIPQNEWVYNGMNATGLKFPNAYARDTPGFVGMNRRVVYYLSACEVRPRGILFMDYFRDPRDMNLLPRIVAALNYIGT